MYPCCAGKKQQLRLADPRATQGSPRQLIYTREFSKKNDEILT